MIVGSTTGKQRRVSTGTFFVLIRSRGSMYFGDNCPSAHRCCLSPHGVHSTASASSLYFQPFPSCEDLEDAIHHI